MNAPEDKAAPGYRAVRVFHPTIQVPDLAAAERWFAEVFGCPSVPLSSLVPSRPEYPTEYSIFTLIREVFIDSIDPKLHFVNGYQRFPEVKEPVLKSIGWYVEGIEALYHGLRGQGIRSIDLSDNIAEGEQPPQSPGGGVITYFTAPADAGLQYQFMREGPFPLDPRTSPGWAPQVVDHADPLGIDCCAHHTILTTQLPRALKFAVDVMKGKLVHEGRNALLGADSVFVFVGDALLEYARPDPGSAAHASLLQALPGDKYYSMSWKVADLGQAERHLVRHGVRIAARSDAGFVTEASTSLGVPWGFTSRLQPGDPRAQTDVEAV
jgi:catechol 2,3-dioxygenase-like lactoylglutathione lyase family enzyme